MASWRFWQPLTCWTFPLLTRTFCFTTSSPKKGKQNYYLTISIYCQIHHIFMFLPFLHNPDTCFKDKSHHRWLWWSSSNLHFLIIIEKYISKAKAALLLLATLQFLARWKWPILGLYDLSRIITDCGKNSTNWFTKFTAFCYFLTYNFSENGLRLHNCYDTHHHQSCDREDYMILT